MLPSVQIDSLLEEVEIPFREDDLQTDLQQLFCTFVGRLLIKRRQEIDRLLGRVAGNIQIRRERREARRGTRQATSRPT